MRSDQVCRPSWELIRRSKPAGGGSNNRVDPWRWASGCGQPLLGPSAAAFVPNRSDSPVRPDRGEAELRSRKPTRPERLLHGDGEVGVSGEGSGARD